MSGVRVTRRQRLLLRLRCPTFVRWFELVSRMQCLVPTRVVLHLFIVSNLSHTGNASVKAVYFPAFGYWFEFVSFVGGVAVRDRLA